MEKDYLAQMLDYLYKVHAIRKNVIAAKIGYDQQKLSNALRATIVTQKEFVNLIQQNYTKELQDFKYTVATESDDNSTDKVLIGALKKQITYLESDVERLRQQNDKLLEKLLNN